MTELSALSALDAVQKPRTGEISPLEVVDAAAGPGHSWEIEHELGFQTRVPLD